MNLDAKPAGNSKSQASLEQRKRLLIAQGAMYRLGLAESKHQVSAGMRVDLLAKSAMNHVFGNKLSALENIFSFKSLKYLKHVRFSGIKLAMPLVLPLLTKGVSTLSRRTTLIKPVLLGSASLAGVIGAGFLLYRWRKVRQQKQLAGFRTSSARRRG